MDIFGRKLDAKSDMTGDEMKEDQKKPETKKKEGRLKDNLIKTHFVAFFKKHLIFSPFVTYHPEWSRIDRGMIMLSSLVVMFNVIGVLTDTTLGTLFKNQ